MKNVCSLIKIVVLQLGIILNSVSLHGQNANTLVSLTDALQLTEDNYPALKSKSLEAEAAKQEIAISRNTLMPSLDAIYQANLATYNNITGMTNPGSVFPITGPASSSNSYQPVYGSAASLALAWQPFTFGQRNAQTKSSTAAANIKTAEYQDELFNQKIVSASAYLDLIYTQAILEIFQEDVDRVSFKLKQSRVLATTGLRPGVDTALFLSEFSKANIDYLNALRNFQVQKIKLSELLTSDTDFTATDTFFLERLPSLQSSGASEIIHPAIGLSQASIDYSYSKEEVLKKAWYPKLTLWGTTFARGSGVHQDGSVNSADGWSFSRYNYGVGMQLAFPILKFSESKLQQEQQNLATKSDVEKLKQVKLQLSKQQEIAEANLQSARTIAQQTPAQLTAARYALNALDVRYNAGLANFTDLMQARYNLVKAEIDLKKCYLDVWKALLYKSAVTGDLNIFLSELTR